TNFDFINIVLSQPSIPTRRSSDLGSMISPRFLKPGLNTVRYSSPKSRTKSIIRNYLSCIKRFMKIHESLRVSCWNLNKTLGVSCGGDAALQYKVDNHNDVNRNTGRIVIRV